MAKRQSAAYGEGALLGQLRRWVARCLPTRGRPICARKAVHAPERHLGWLSHIARGPVPNDTGITCEGENAPIRHRLSRGGNRRLNAAIHRTAMIRLPFEPGARRMHDQARAHGHTRREAMRGLERNLSDAIYRTLLHDARRLADLA